MTPEKFYSSLTEEQQQHLNYLTATFTREYTNFITKCYEEITKPDKNETQKSNFKKSTQRLRKKPKKS